MKNKCSNAILFLVVILPFTLFSYQNCSQLQSTEIESLSSQINFLNSEPLMLEDLAQINYTEGNTNCSDIDSGLVFYHSRYNLCAVAENTCESSFLQEQEYFLASSENCENAISNDEMTLNGFNRKTLEDLGYVENQNTFCTQVVSSHVNLFTKVCATATDGCEASYLSDIKFIEDTFGLCD